MRIYEIKVHISDVPVALINRWQTSKESEKEKTFALRQNWGIDCFNTLQRSSLCTPVPVVRFWDNSGWCRNLKLPGGTHSYDSQTMLCNWRFSNGWISQVLTSELGSMWVFKSFPVTIRCMEDTDTRFLKNWLVLYFTCFIKLFTSHILANV